MSVRRRTLKDGKTFSWEFCITIQKEPRKQYRKGGFKTKAEALEKEREALTKLKVGELFSCGKMLFKDLALMYLEHIQKQFEKSTYNHYKMIYDVHLQAFYNMQISKITPYFIQNWVDNVMESKTPFVINASLKFCKTAFNYGIKLEILEKNPFKNIEKVKVQPKKHGHLNLDEALRVLKICKTSEPDFYPILAMAVFTGLRRGEILGLQWSDIDFKNGTAHIQRQVAKEGLKDKTKTSSSRRVIDLTSNLLQILKEHKANQRVLSKFVFCNRCGEPLNPSNIGGRVFKRVLKKAGYPEDFMRFHDLRGTYVDISATEGIPMKYTQSQLGHSKISTTYDIYHKILPDMRKRAINTLENAINKNSNFCEHSVNIDVNTKK